MINSIKGGQLIKRAAVREFKHFFCKDNSQQDSDNVCNKSIFIKIIGLVLSRGLYFPITIIFIFLS